MTARAQKTENGLYIETTKFEPYLTKTKGQLKNSRYDKVGRLWLVFASSPDDTLDIWLYDYDNAGNLTHQTSLCLGKDPQHLYRWVAPYNMTEQQFADIVQKVLDRLDDK